MKVTLIYPSFKKIIKKNQINMYPLSVAVLAALTPDRIDVAFYDDRFEEIPYGEETDLVALSAETYNVLRAYEIADRYRSGNIPVVIGGIHASLLPDEVSAHADSIVIGDAEQIWGHVLEDAENNRLQRVYRSSLESEKTLLHVPPKRNIFKGRRYFPSDIVETGRGCVHACDFCVVACIYRGRYRTKTIEDIANDVSSIRQKNLYFADDNFVASPQRTIDLCKAIAPLKKRWVVEGGITLVNHDELMKWMSKAGCVCILIGFESLNNETLKNMGKSWTNVRRSYRESIKRLRDHGICIYGSFVFGYDSDVKDDIERTLEFAIEEKLALAGFLQLVPFPGTPLYERLKKQNRLLYDRWWLDPSYEMEKPLFIPSHMEPDELADTCVRCRKQFYSYSSVFRRMIDLKANLRNADKAFFYFMANLSPLKNTIVQDN